MSLAGKSLLFPRVLSVFSKVGTDAAAPKGVSECEDVNCRTEATGGRAALNHLVVGRRILCLPSFRQRMAASETHLATVPSFFPFFLICVNILKNQDEIHMHAYLVLLHFADVAFSYKL